MHSSLKVKVLCNNVYERTLSTYSVCHRTLLSLSVDSLVMLGVNDCAAAMCECGDYITYNSNMVIAILKIFSVLQTLKVEITNVSKRCPKRSSGVSVYVFINMSTSRDRRKTLP